LASRVSRVGARSLAGWRPKSRGLAPQVSRVGVRGRPGIASTSWWTSCRVGRERVSRMAVHSAARPWSRMDAPRGVVPSQRGHGTYADVTQSAIDRDGGVDRPGREVRTGWTSPWLLNGCGIDGLCTRRRCPVRMPPVVSGGGSGPLWTLTDAAMDIAGRRYGHCRPPLRIFPGAIAWPLPRSNPPGCSRTP
jgi:hypothetical protein